MAVVKINNNKITSYKSKTYSASYRKEPIQFVDEYSTENLSKFFGFRDVIAIEKLRGKKFNIFFDGTNVEFRNHSNVLIPKGDDYLGFKKLFYDKYAKNYIKLLERLKKVPFNLHGEIIGFDANPDIEYFKDKNKIDFFFYDIYINSNWMDWGDFYLLMEEFNLPMVSVFYNGEWKDGDFFNNLSLRPNMEGIIVRPKYEDTVENKRLITKFTCEKFRSKTKNEWDDFKTDIRIFLFKAFSSSRVLWESALLTKGIDKKNKKNFSAMMKISSKMAMEEINSHLVSEYFLESGGDFARSEILKTMKKELPSMIKHILRIK